MMAPKNHNNDTTQKTRNVNTRWAANQSTKKRYFSNCMFLKKKTKPDGNKCKWQKEWTKKTPKWIRKTRNIKQMRKCRGNVSHNGCNAINKWQLASNGTRKALSNSKNFAFCTINVRCQHIELEQPSAVGITAKIQKLFHSMLHNHLYYWSISLAQYGWVFVVKALESCTHLMISLRLLSLYLVYLIQSSNFK